MDLLPVSLRDSASSDRHVLQPRAHVPHHRLVVSLQTRGRVPGLTMGVKATRFFALVLGYADAHKVLSRTRTRALGRVRVKHLIPRKAGKASRPKSTQ